MSIDDLTSLYVAAVRTIMPAGRGGGHGGLCSRLAVALVAFTSAMAPAAPAAGRRDAAGVRSDFAVYSDPRFNLVLDQVGSPPLTVDASGALGANLLWQHGKLPTWYIEQQDLVYPTLLRGLRDLSAADLTAGVRAFDWGFRRQARDGSFPGSGNEFHSTSYFVAAVAHVCLFERAALAAGVAVPAWAQARIRAYVRKIHAAARWMARPAVWREGLALNRPFGHRRFLVGAAMGLTAALTHDRLLERRADEVIAGGLRIQRPNGVIPERGGHDSGYQPVGMIYAEDWLSYNRHDPLAARVARAIRRGLAWERSRVLPNGRVSTAGNTRTGGQERTWDGSLKTVSYLQVGRPLVWWGAATGDTASLRVAYRLLSYSLAHGLS
jgi:hypothetical protein